MSALYHKMKGIYDMKTVKSMVKGSFYFITNTKLKDKCISIFITIVVFIIHFMYCYYYHYA